MSKDMIQLRGTLKADGTLELPGKVALPPGPVEVTVRPVEAPQGEDLLRLLARIRAEQQASGHVARSREEIDEEVRQMRDEWEDNQRGPLREECQRAGTSSDPTTESPT
jgi:hypothetical protein